MAAAPQSERSPKVAEVIAGVIRRQIVTGELVEGDLLPPEAELMEHFGVSRPTLREAFRVLESEALISVRRGSQGGAQVHAPDMAVAARYMALLLQARKVTVAEVYQARLIIEPAAVRLLAERRPKAALVELRRLLDEERRVIDDRMAYAAASTAFHEKVVELGGNEVLSVVTTVLHEVVLGHIATATAVGAERGEPHQDGRANKAHERLLELLRSGNADEAEKFWRVHMEAAGRLLLRDLSTTTVLDLFS